MLKAEHRSTQKHAVYRRRRENVWCGFESGTKKKGGRGGVVGCTYRCLAAAR